uniref:G-protein coupled receptors family 1 profile domain-containing protein n=1 Tax=Neovison vison TaxID=452646 RepID=A0A8C7AU58_NEOVI
LLRNVTLITKFLLMGFPDDKVLQRPYAVFFSLVYLMALMGNLFIITLITIDQHLQKPMYFFLKKLSLIDICYISVTVFLILVFAGTVFALLLVMSYDRYAAIRCPLHYEAIMNRGACVQMVTSSWFNGCIYGSIHVAGTFSVHFCGPNIVHQFLCNIPSLLTLACSGDQTLEYVFIIVSCCFAFVCFTFMVASCGYIASTVLRIPSLQRRFKTFSTCMPHLTVITLFLSSGYIVYLGSTSKSPTSMNLFMSVLYSLLPPSLNPVIYSLRNRDMKVTLGNISTDVDQQNLC